MIKIKSFIIKFNYMIVLGSDSILMLLTGFLIDLSKWWLFVVFDRLAIWVYLKFIIIFCSFFMILKSFHYFVKFWLFLLAIGLIGLTSLIGCWLEINWAYSKMFIRFKSKRISLLSHVFICFFRFLFHCYIFMINKFIFSQIDKILNYITKSIVYHSQMPSNRFGIIFSTITIWFEIIRLIDCQIRIRLRLFVIMYRVMIHMTIRMIIDCKNYLVFIYVIRELEGKYIKNKKKYEIKIWL